MIDRAAVLAPRLGASAYMPLEWWRDALAACARVLGKL